MEMRSIHNSPLEEDDVGISMEDACGGRKVRDGDDDGCVCVC
jgi:hypothetical protein